MTEEKQHTHKQSGNILVLPQNSCPTEEHRIIGMRKDAQHSQWTIFSFRRHLIPLKLGEGHL